MTRCGSFVSLWSACWLLASLTPAWAEDAPGKDKVLAALAVQRAISDADHYHRNGKTGAAVQELELHLAEIDGNPRYLQRLRQAYIDHITTLHFNRQKDEAEKYIRRLRILDPQMADRLAKGIAPEAVTTAGSLAKDAATPAVPKFVPTVYEEPTSSAPAPAVPAQLATMPAGKPAVTEHTGASDLQKPKFVARGKMTEEAPDPFAADMEYGRPGAAVKKDSGAGRAFLSQAEELFRQQQYGAARQLYQQAYAAERGLSADCKNRWAYCMLNHVVEQLNRGSDVPVVSLEAEVKQALTLASNEKLNQTGKTLLARLAERQGGPQSTAGSVAVQHLQRNAQGWEVAESEHFRIFHRQKRDLVEQVVRVAESTRAAMQHKWFGSGAQAWRHKCDIYLHADAKEYSQRTGVPGQSPGHSRIESDSTTGDVVSRQIDLRCDNPDLLPAVLPHETTHVVLAGQFGKQPVPRWVDEGVAVLTEPAQKIELHRRNLGRFAASRELFQVRELMELNDYPASRRIGAFYAQSVSLVDFLTRQRGPLIFTQFIRDGLQQGYPAALQRHYGFRDYNELQEQWSRQLDDGEPVAGLSRR